MQLILLVIVLLAVLLGPNLWVKRVMDRYSRPRDRYGGTGAELARRLLDECGLTSVAVEETDQGDHYDPGKKAVRLSADNHGGGSLTAVTVAAHEVGHALQDARGFTPFRARTRLVILGRNAERIGAGLLMTAPLIAIVTRAPGVTALMLLGGLLTLGSPAVIHLITLPTEFDASFGRALPLLEQGEYLHPPDYPHARRILRAAAMTYVAASLMSILNVARWWTLLRR